MKSYRNYEIIVGGTLIDREMGYYVTLDHSAQTVKKRFGVYAGDVENPAFM